MSDLDDEELEATRRLNGVARKKNKEHNDTNVGSKEKDIMSEEAFNELIDNFEVVEKLTEYGRKAIKQNVKRLQKRIKELEEALLKVKDKNTTLFITCRNSIPKQKLKDLIKSEIISISGFECIAVEELEQLLEDK